MLLPAVAARSTIDTPLQLEAFFRHHASNTVHAELRTFCADLGWHPTCGAETLLDQLGLHVLPLRRALDTATPAGTTSTARGTAF
ncbi:hypothetical protein ACGF5C_24310 [Micromonospora sp. NPDC047620]|uniref:hypothetical protein n=1 Tax=Micromonospora sp. NPDC047620 TaxID=3364251 RepID=UPI00371C41A6